jgi:hypothetical protein
MEAIYLDCGARRPQLKRNPLYSGGHHDKGLVVFRCARHVLLANYPPSDRGAPLSLQLVPMG